MSIVVWHLCNKKSKISLSPDGRRVVVAPIMSAVEVRDTGTYNLLCLIVVNMIVNEVAYCERLGGDLVAAGFEGGMVGVWRLAPDGTSSEHLFTLDNHESDIGFLVFSPCNNKLATASSDNTVCVWDMATGALLATLEGHTCAVWAVAFTRDGQRMITGSEDKTISIWSAITYEHIKIVEIGGHCWSLDVSPNGKYVAFSCSNEIHVMDIETCNIVHEIGTHTSTIHRLAYTRDGRHVATASHDASCQIWDVSGPDAVCRYIHYSKLGFNALQFTRDGSKMLVATYDNIVALIDVTVFTIGARVLAMILAGRRQPHRLPRIPLNLWSLITAEFLCE